jgi:hypothetical protein
VPDPSEPKSLKELLFETVDTFEELEVLVWFHDRGEGSVSGATLLGQQTVAPPEAAEVALASLATRGILSASSAKPDQFLYVPSAEAREAIDQIVREYRENPVQVMGLMTANAIERVRTAAARTFAESFRFRRPK